VPTVDYRMVSGVLKARGEVSPLNAQLNPICQSRFAELFCGYLNFARVFR
jgi:hypothetical protein